MEKCPSHTRYPRLFKYLLSARKVRGLSYGRIQPPSLVGGTLELETRVTHPGVSESYPSPPVMSAIRLLSSAARRTPKSVPLGRRGYAEVSDKIKLSLVLPHQVRVNFSYFRLLRVKNL